MQLSELEEVYRRKRPGKLLAVFEDYNHRRIHSALKYLMPSELAGKYRQGSEGVIPDITGGDNCE